LNEKGVTKLKKFLFSLLAIVALIGCLGAGYAYYSDTETSNDNTFTAGTLNLTLDTAGTCNVTSNMTETDGGEGINDSIVFTNLKPGDNGTITWIATNTGNLPGMIMVHRTLSEDYDGVNPEPETEIEAGINATTPGELDNNMWLRSWVYINDVTTNSDPIANPWQAWMSTEADWGVDQFDSLPMQLGAGQTLKVIYEWNIPTDVGNIIQGDTFKLNLEFALGQIEGPTP
jgi:predicted ribosomally synthesized peptide with SipW-like signal peptide